MNLVTCDTTLANRFTRERALRAVSGNATNSSTYFSADTSNSNSYRKRRQLPFVWTKNKIKRTEHLARTMAKFRRSERQSLSLRSGRTPDFQRESTRLCKKSKKCFRRNESLIKRSKYYEEGKRGLIQSTSRENKVRNQECLCSWRKPSLQACSKTKPLFTNFNTASEKVR